MKMGAKSVTKRARAAGSPRATRGAPSLDASTTSLSDKVVQTVRDGIRDGRYVPGQRLFEKELVDQIEVGRGSVREALRLLVADGLVEIVPHRGATIRQFTRDEVWALHEIREVLEGLAASLAASRSNGADAKRKLVNAEKDIQAAIEKGDRDAYRVRNAHLHALIVEMSGNSQLQDSINRSYAAPLRLQTARFVDVPLMRKRAEEHHLVVKAILKGDSAAAEAAMRAHIRSSRDVLLLLPEFLFARS
jgi:DNA-binding GntR family transcriptional regulator